MDKYNYIIISKVEKECGVFSNLVLMSSSRGNQKQ